MPGAINTESYLFGPATSLKFNGVELGGTDGPSALSIKETKVDHRPLGTASPIAGLSRITQVAASLKVKLNEFSLAKLQWVLHNITPVVGTAATTTPSGLATTLVSDAAAGATSIVLTAATNIADDKYLKVGDAGETEIVKVDPSWTAGTTIPLTTPLIRAHDAGDAVVMVNDAGTTILQQRIGPIAVGDHHDVVMQAVGPDGEPAVVTIFSALSEGSLDIELGEADPAGTPVTFTGYASKTDPTLAPWAWERLTP